jgi:hypothetical protein
VLRGVLAEWELLQALEPHELVGPLVFSVDYVVAVLWIVVKVVEAR